MTMTKTELIEALTIPYTEFQSAFVPRAREIVREKGNRLYAMAMLGYTNVCKNQCLYCGMRAGNKIPRYRIPPEDIVAAAGYAKSLGYERIFLIAGEDPAYSLDVMLPVIRQIADSGMRISMAGGEFPLDGYKKLRGAGLTEYVLKFEMAHPDTFNRLNPSTNHAQRMAGIRAIQESGLLLASGNIVDYPGQTIEELADEILLMISLGISWAPVIPYLPAKGAPLGGERGDITLCHREITLLRHMLPDCRLTAQLPGYDLTRGLSDDLGNRLALEAGADILFADLLPDAQAKQFSVVDHRTVLGLPHIRKMAEETGRTVWLSRAD